MALPDNELASQFFPAAFSGGRGLPILPRLDYETGGIALNDPSAGHLVQVWSARVVDSSHIVISNETGFETTYYSDFNITEVSLTFDQNMRPAISLVADGQPKLIWYDTQEAQEVVTDLASDVRSPRVSLDDKRTTQMSTNDIILAYLRGNNLYHRRQRDRFTIEYLLAEGIVPDEDWYLRRIGMNNVGRFQFELWREWNAEEQLNYTLSQAPAQVTGTAQTVASAVRFDADSSTIYAPDNEESNND
jgi:hypothetical protein